jgi:telomerase protein component 1
MCKYVCEDCDFQVYSSPSPQHPNTNHLSVELKDGTILDNMKVVAETAKQLGPDGIFPYDYLEDMIREKRRVDNLLVLSHQVLNPGQGQNQLANLLNKYRSEVNPDMLFVSVDLSGSGKTTIGSDEKHPLDIMITGFSDQILRFIAERGDQNQVQYVEHIDEAKNLNKKEDRQAVYETSPWWRWLDSLGQEHEISRYPNIVTGRPWRNIRIFISSTFLDMHGERDILTRIVFPELKERCKQRRINVYEVDLRWGVTEEESQSGKSIELCLSEVERCKPFFIGILGNRYGWVSDKYDVPDHSRFDWVRQYPTGRSITELEIQLAVLNDPYAATGSFFYFRDNLFTHDVP